MVPWIVILQNLGEQGLYIVDGAAGAGWINVIYKSSERGKGSFLWLQYGYFKYKFRYRC